jgi:hypothetical protein
MSNPVGAVFGLCMLALLIWGLATILPWQLTLVAAAVLIGAAFNA